MKPPRTDDIALDLELIDNLGDLISYCDALCERTVMGAAERKICEMLIDKAIWLYDWSDWNKANLGESDDA